MPRFRFPHLALPALLAAAAPMLAAAPAWSLASSNLISTATTLTASTATPVVGQDVTYTATVTGADNGTPTGSVVFTGDAGTLCALTLNQQSPDQATCTFPYGAPGTDSVTAAYLGDDNLIAQTGYTGSTSSAVSESISEAATSTAVTSSDPNPVVGETVTYTATVVPNAPGGGSPTGSVSFTGSNSGPLCTATLNQADPDVATCAWTYRGPGTDSVTAGYAGDGNYESSSSSAQSESITVAQTTTVVSSSPASPVVGQSVTYTATVAPVSPGSGTPTGDVAISGNSGPLCTPSALQGSLDQAICTTTYTSALSDAVTAQYPGDGNFAGSTSSVLDVSVTAASTSTSLSVSNTSPLVGQSVTFTATVAVTAPGVSTPTGSVTFTAANAGPLCTASLSASSPYTATCSAPFPGAESDSVTATYSGDGNDLTSTSSAVAVTIGQASTTTTLTTSSATLVVGQPVTYTATVKPTSPGGGNPAGTVTFKGFAGALCSNVALNGQSPDTATCQIVYGTGGSTDSVTATFAGNLNYGTSVSGKVAETIARASTAATLSANVAATSAGQQVTFTTEVDTVALGSGVAEGSVVFTQTNGTKTATICDSTLSDTVPDLATCSVSETSLGSNTVTALYEGSANFLGSVSNTLSVAVTGQTATTVSTSPASAVSGQEVTITANVAAVAPATGTPTGYVAFTIENAAANAIACSGSTNTKVLGSGNAKCTIPAKTVLASGSPLSIQASYQGTAKWQPSSGTATETTTPDGTSVTVTSGHNPSAPGAQVTFTAVVTDASPGTAAPSGTVTFSFSDVALSCSAGDTVTLGAEGHATCKVLAGGIEGPVTVTATYAGSADYNSSNGSLNQTVS